MTITMTVGGVDCGAKDLDNEITCRIPKNMTIPSEGLAVKVSLTMEGFPIKKMYMTYLPDYDSIIGTFQLKRKHQP